MIVAAQSLLVRASCVKMSHKVKRNPPQVARKYYNCSSLSNLPLMAENPLGASQRGSHWETRIMNDEFMSYGENSLVSAFTLAMMEDLGHYLGNYSNAQCMYWGLNQGCDFVSSRCGTRRDDMTGVFGKGEAFARDFTYEDTQRNDLLMRKCGVNSNVAVSGKRLNKGPDCLRQWRDTSKVGSKYECQVKQCYANAECYSKEGADPAKLTGACESPTGLLIAAGERSASGEQAFGLDIVYVIVAVAAFVVMLFIISVIRCIKSSKFTSLVFAAYIIDTIFVIIGLGMFGTCVYFYIDPEVWEGVLQQKHLLGMVLFSLFILTFAIYGIVAVCCALRCKTHCCKLHKVLIGLFNLILFCIILVQTFGALLAFMWVYDSYSFTSGTYVAAVDMSDRKIQVGISAIDEYAHHLLNDVGGYACNSYKKCCFEDFELERNNSMYVGGSRTCTSVQAGQTGGGGVDALKDPSKADFCQLTTNSDLKFRPPRPVCFALDKAKLINLTHCKEHFCDDGRAGFEAFIARIFSWIRDHVIPVGIFLGLLGLLEASQLVIGAGLWCSPAKGLQEAQARASPSHRSSEKLCTIVFARPGVGSLRRTRLCHSYLERSQERLRLLGTRASPANEVLYRVKPKPHRLL